LLIFWEVRLSVLLVVVIVVVLFCHSWQCMNGWLFAVRYVARVCICLWLWGRAVFRASVSPSLSAVFWRRLVRPCSSIFEFFMSFIVNCGVFVWVLVLFFCFRYCGL
jgi:hypothetical protein